MQARLPQEVSFSGTQYLPTNAMPAGAFKSSFFILFNLFLFHRNFTVNKWRVCVRAATPSVLWQRNVKWDCQFTEGSDCCHLIPLLLLKKVAGLKEASDNKENNNIYLLIHSLYIS